ncbi:MULTISPECIES: hypothetical protein [Idiomarina]|uniref:hypothetical protein n=1 Tax=Idiomarina TaxID=135575 RepID=UPI000C09E3AE|nr:MULTISPECIES: hypothetical protein [Idiomarina]MAB21743.1 hypothetical protein [Idiomarina sp.]MAL82965.1 hypothetical protein [Idiomarina sp.]MAO68047.1 hypothetical protein [Idiomarina sp.]MBF79799.1 hypothetical protein [Idiomarina sp.]MBH95472.1 hypothetical protein [Idiomarina sp.]
MNFNATLLGQVILIFIPIIVILSYYLGKRKTQTPKLATLIGLILAFIPPLALIYVAALVIKNDVRVSE